ncbi:spore germination protein [Sporolactobacillus sp. CQH2019]|uniref:spore germination protein n=1 Tax=Sporolactobacillus sp. CQH2019 TaxID=3023512 RepID=UPI0023678BF1|nr:spore germination protein [Sporolactobacillus sp. CQH2019]MDD9147730.1 spore germination protein [Sporolactobacillus sp. CQH2019]
MRRKKANRKPGGVKKLQTITDRGIGSEGGKETVKTSISENELQKVFAGCSDIHFQQMRFGDHQAIIVNCEGMVDKEMLNQSMFPKMENFFQSNQNAVMTKDRILQSLHLPDLAEVTDEKQMTDDVFSGKVLFYLKNGSYIFSADISKRPQRTPEETRTEVSIKGPRDNFIEDLSINIALIRKRLKTTSLKVENYQIGRRSRTPVGLLFIKDIANKHILDELRKCIKAIDVDAVYGGNQFMELIEKVPFLIPKHSYSGRPDFVVESLLSGRCAILIDGVAYANIVPTNLFFLLKSSGDSEFSSFYSSFERALRIFGVFFAAYLPGFWVAITTFHQNQLPLTLLAPVVESRQGLPLPTGLEAIVVIILFELLKESGMRMPQSIGFTVSVVGGLIIGQAVIDARLTSPAMMVVIAVSTISTFTFTNQGIIGAISLLRIATIVLASFLGLFGFILSFFFIIVYVSNLRIFGLPYMEMLANLDFFNIVKAMFRLPARYNKKRPVMLFSRDNTPKGKN